jgi:hypothetical protein
MTVKYYNFIAGCCLEQCALTGKINIRQMGVFNLLLEQFRISDQLLKQRKAHKEF